MLSGGGYVIFLVDKWLRSELFMWTGTRIRRVVESSLAAQALMIVDGEEAVRRMVEEIVDVEAEEMGLVVKDTNGLMKILASSHVVQERRL